MVVVVAAVVDVVVVVVGGAVVPSVVGGVSPRCAAAGGVVGGGASGADATVAVPEQEVTNTREMLRMARFMSVGVQARSRTWIDRVSLDSMPGTAATLSCKIHHLHPPLGAFAQRRRRMPAKGNRRFGRHIVINRNHGSDTNFRPRSSVAVPGRLRPALTCRHGRFPTGYLDPARAPLPETESSTGNFSSPCLSCR